MDPVSLIVAALAAGVGAVGAGAAEGVATSAKDAVAALYGQLKALIIGRPAATEMGAARLLDKHGSNPDGYRTAVEDLVAESGAAADPQIVALAEELLRVASDAGLARSYTVTQTATASGGSTVNQAGRDQQISGT